MICLGLPQEMDALYQLSTDPPTRGMYEGKAGKDHDISLWTGATPQGHLKLVVPFLIRVIFLFVVVTVCGTRAISERKSKPVVANIKNVHFCTHKKAAICCFFFFPSLHGCHGKKQKSDREDVSWSCGTSYSFPQAISLNIINFKRVYGEASSFVLLQEFDAFPHVLARNNPPASVPEI